VTKIGTRTPLLYLLSLIQKYVRQAWRERQSFVDLLSVFLREPRAASREPHAVNAIHLRALSNHAAFQAC
jgi:hypothetical protein